MDRKRQGDHLMAAKGSVWKINRDVMEAMLRLWLNHTRCQDDPADLSLLNMGHDGRFFPILNKNFHYFSTFFSLFFLFSLKIFLYIVKSIC
jgi:hypothetical protein